MATTPTPPSEAPPTVVLAKRGDILLKLGDANLPKVSLLVSSGALSTVSPVFEDMFNARFKEGQSLSSAAPREIELPDDDPLCMTILCKIIHLQIDDIPRQLDVINLANFAVLCDKYACINAVRPWSRIWVLELLPATHIPGYDKLLMISYVMDLPDEFFKVTQSLIRNRTFCVDMEVAAHGHDFIPKSVFVRLQKAQVLYQNQVVDTLEPRFGSSNGLTSTCPESSTIVKDYFSKLKDRGLWPTKAMVLTQYRDQLKSMPSLVTSKCHCSLWAFCKTAPTLKDTILQRMNTIIDSTQGICLDCVYQDNGKEGLKCRIKHGKEPF
ncbi:hypothetical protein K505DRAFT_365000 [Melanomma pulvis-pyrius CBS 109.77]|uniref:BTB domain-containing protein n=1 Tax=Melanomma pulvis-pyrius CBS 109.77 TaxID=1314802 RepID=A0A6A6X2H4_9PLEO|nr:hypothetical protein K505DRAFT_365000 [Melanomma pulvis-pyrius CBS 109.77]